MAQGRGRAKKKAWHGGKRSGGSRAQGQQDAPQKPKGGDTRSAKPPHPARSNSRRLSAKSQQHKGATEEPHSASAPRPSAGRATRPRKARGGGPRAATGPSGAQPAPQIVPQHLRLAPLLRTPPGLLFFVWVRTGGGGEGARLWIRRRALRKVLDL